MMERQMQKVLWRERALCPKPTRRLVEEIEILLEMERMNSWKFKP
jgi:hypothetical protein